ncbi:MAG: type IV conjugative transfer system protein TraL [Nitrospiria bacterium]
MFDDDFKIPRHIDDPQRFMFWELDELGVMVSFMMIGVLFNFFFVGTVLGIIFMFMLSKIKSGRPRGFFMHWLYHKNLIDIPGLPPSEVKEFHE